MIDIKNAKEVFKEYVKNYNLDDGRIMLKVKHILRVAEISRDIALKNNLNEEDVNLAELIGLLHDIGRFEQVKVYNTFKDYESVNHAKLGVKILFEDGLIRKFIDEPVYDEIIKTAILNHNKGRIDDTITGKTLDFCKIIRDADKVDIFYVLLEEDFIDAYGMADMSEELVTDEILREFKEDRIIDYTKRETGADLIISHIAYIFDFNYKYCLDKINNEKYIYKLVKKANFKNKDTINKMQEVLRIAQDYIESKE